MNALAPVAGAASDANAPPIKATLEPASLPSAASQTAAAPASRLHLDYLDGLRGLAALLVLIHHAYIQVWNIFDGAHPPGLANSLTRWMIYGHFAVSVFIVLSGFCLMLPIVRGDGTLRGGAALFFRKRARRILPPYYSALLVSIVVARLAPRIHIAVTPSGIVTHLLLVHNLSPAHVGGINGALWSIAVEWQIYFLFPLLVWAWRRAGGLSTVVAATTAAYGVSYFARPTPFAGLTPHYVALFAFGMLGSAIAFAPNQPWRGWRERLPWRAILTGLVASLLAWCHWLGWERALGAAQTVTDFGVGLGAMALLIAASPAQANGIRRALSWKPLVVLGAFAYSLYLVHLPLLLVAWQYGVRPLRLPSLAAFALLLLGVGPCIVGAAWLFHLVCERPFLSPATERNARFGRRAGV